MEDQKTLQSKHRVCLNVSSYLHLWNVSGHIQKPHCFLPLSTKVEMKEEAPWDIYALRPALCEKPRGRT